jgi:hypothetical protein
MQSEDQAEGGKMMFTPTQLAIGAIILVLIAIVFVIMIRKELQ